MLGPPGVGKTHLAISLAIAAAQNGRRVYYGTLAELITSLEEARAAGTLARRLAVLSHPSLLVVDELGYLPVNQTGAVLFFQLMSRRYERASTVLTSNKSFEEWGDMHGGSALFRKKRHQLGSTHTELLGHLPRLQPLKPPPSRRWLFT